MHAATHPIPQAKNPNDDAAPLEIVDWFYSSENTMQNATDNSRKMDFGLRNNGPDYMPHENNSPDFTRVEVVAEHTSQRNLSQQEWMQLAGYARFALHNQLDRYFIFGLLIHKLECYVAIFLDSCIVVASPFLLSNLVTAIRAVAALLRLDL